MRARKSIERLASGILCGIAFAALVAGCSQTAAPAPNIVERAQGETPTPPPPSGFLGKEYSLLQPAGESSDQQAQLRYIASNVQWSKYTKIMVLPVPRRDSSSAQRAGGRERAKPWRGGRNLGLALLAMPWGLGGQHHTRKDNLYQHYCNIRLAKHCHISDQTLKALAERQRFVT